MLKWIQRLSGCMKNASSCSLRTCLLPLIALHPRIVGELIEAKYWNRKITKIIILDWYTSQEPLWSPNKSPIISFGQMWEHSNLKVFEPRAQLFHFVLISKENTVSKAHLWHRNWSHCLGGSCELLWGAVLHGPPQFGGQKAGRTVSANLCCRSR